jgi:hypothetical protein
MNNEAVGRRCRCGAGDGAQRTTSGGADCGPMAAAGNTDRSVRAGTQETAADRTLPAARRAKIMPAPITLLAIDRVFVPVFLPPNICQQSSGVVHSPGVTRSHQRIKAGIIVLQRRASCARR